MSHKAAESAGKMPDALEEARKWPKRACDCSSCLVELLADIQKRTLLAAAEEIRQKYQPGNMNPLNGAIELLEHLAEEIGRQG